MDLNVKMLHLTLPFMNFHCLCYNFTTVIDILVNEDFAPGNYSYFTFSNVTTLFKKGLNSFFPQISTPNTQYRQHEKFVFKFWQPPSKTNKQTNKNPNKNPITKVFTAFAKYFVDAPLAAITASSLCKCDAASLAHLSLACSSAAPPKLRGVGWGA